MGTNSEIYLIGLAILFFLVIVFLFVRKITNSNNLKVKIEKIPNPLESLEKDKDLTEDKSEDLYESDENQELVCFYLISSDKSMFDIDQIFAFLGNYGAKIKNKYFSLVDENGFENTALKFSTSMSSKDFGNIGWINKESLTPRVSKILDNLKIGEVSPPIKNLNTLLFLKLTDLRITKVNEINLEELKKKIINQKKMSFSLYFQEAIYLS